MRHPAHGVGTIVGVHATTIEAEFSSGRREFLLSVPIVVLEAPTAVGPEPRPPVRRHRAPKLPDPPVDLDREWLFPGTLVHRLKQEKFRVRRGDEFVVVRSRNSQPDNLLRLREIAPDIVAVVSLQNAGSGRTREYIRIADRWRLRVAQALRSGSKSGDVELVVAALQRSSHALGAAQTIGPALPARRYIKVVSGGLPSLGHRR